MRAAKTKIGVLILNLGTPNSPSVSHVRAYLREFLMDGRVIDIPFWKRWLLIHLIIAPTRAPQSARAYQHLWTKEGSPLKMYGEQTVALLQQALGPRFEVVLGMRYQSPSIASALEQFRGQGLERLIVLPLYPQYASASTGSTHEEVMRLIQRWEVIPATSFISQFCDHPQFIRAFAERAEPYLKKPYDHYLFSYHGLPERQILKASCGGYCRLKECCLSYHTRNRYCYRAQCFETTRLLAKELSIAPEKLTVCFQSRLGKTPWIKPYSDEVITSLAKQGIKRVLVFSPSFVADCLETTVEIGMEYQKQFQDLGGECLDLVESLNTSSAWIECLKRLVVEHAQAPV